MNNSSTGNRSGRIAAMRWLVVAMVAVVALALTVVGHWRGDGSQRVGVSAAGETAEEPSGAQGTDDGDESPPVRADHDHDRDGRDEQGETVVVELPSVLEGEPPVEVEVRVAVPDEDEEEVSHGELTSGAAGRVGVGEVPVENRHRLVGSGIELEGRVDRPNSVGFWMRQPDGAEDGRVFVVRGDLSEEERPRAGDAGAVFGVWRMTGERDDELRRVGLEPGEIYVWALGWSR